MTEPFVPKRANIVVGGMDGSVLSLDQIADLYGVSDARKKAKGRQAPPSLWDHFNRACLDFFEHPEKGFSLSTEIRGFPKWLRPPMASFVDIQKKPRPFAEECALAAKRGQNNQLPPLVMPLCCKKTSPIDWVKEKIRAPGYKCFKDFPLISTTFSFGAREDFEKAANARGPVHLIGVPRAAYQKDSQTQYGRYIVSIWVPSGGVYTGELPFETRTVLTTPPSDFVRERESFSLR